MLRKIIPCFFSAILLILSFPKSDLEIVAWFGLVPWLIAIEDKSPKKAFGLSYLVGMLFFLGIFYWLIYVTFVGWVLLSAYSALYFGVFGLIVSQYQKTERTFFDTRSSILDTGNHFFQNRASSIQHRASMLLFSPFSSFILTPCLWVALEFVRSRLFTGFGWVLLGYSQYRALPLIQISDITGPYGVSFLIVMVNVFIREVIIRGRLWFTPLEKSPPQKKIAKFLTGFVVDSLQKEKITHHFRRIFGIVLFLMVFTLAYGYWRLSQDPEGEKLKISVIQGNIPQPEKWDSSLESLILERYITLTKLASFDNPGLIIWPETSVPGCLETEPMLFREIASLANAIKIPLLVGSPRECQTGQDSLFNSGILISPEGTIQEHYDKLHLVPFGEYIPLEKVFGFLRRFVLIGDFIPGNEYTLFQLPATRHQPQVTSHTLTGTGKTQDIRHTSQDTSHKSQATGHHSPLTTHHSPKFGVLICFEDTFPHLVRRFVKKGALFMVNITNDAWFGDSGAPYQHAVASVFRAVENKVPVVRSANTGLSCFISSKGEIVGRVYDSHYRRELLVTGYKTSEIELINTPTFYTHHGDLFALLCIGISVISLLSFVLTLK